MLAHWPYMVNDGWKVQILRKGTEMNDKQKLWAAIVAAVTALMAAIAIYLGVNQDPSEPTEPPVTNAIEVWQGETVFIYVDNGFTTDAGLGLVTGYKKRPITTLMPSFEGARVGDYYDALEPSNEADIVAIKITGDPGLYQTSEGAYRVLDQQMPENPPFPMYAELNSYECLRTYFKATGDTQNWAMQGPITRKYADLLRSFWVEPFKHSIRYYPPDITRDGWGTTEYSYKTLVLDTAIAEPLIWAGELTTAPPAGFISQLPPGSLYYGQDEAGSGPGGGTVEQAIARIEYILREDPQALILQTGLWREQYLAFPVLFAPVRNVYDALPDAAFSKFWMIYGSCMATGNCALSQNPRPRTPYPVHVVEGDPIGDWERAILEAASFGANAYMHYAATKRLSMYWEPGGIYNEGGNGDGTLLAFDPETGDPWPTVRLMHSFIALQKVAKER